MRAAADGGCSGAVVAVMLCALASPAAAANGPAPSAIASPTSLAEAGFDTSLAPRLQDADVVSFEAVVKHAMAHAVEVSIARAQLQYGDAAIEGARPFLPENPDVQVGMGARFHNLAPGATFEVQAQATQGFEIGRERKRRLAAARKLRDLNERALEQVRWDTYARVHLAYNRALVASARAEMVNRLLRFSESLLDVTRKRAAAGEISELRVRVAEGELAQARQAKLDADLRFRLACVDLSRAAGYPVDKLVAPIGDVETPRKIVDVAVLIEFAGREHPAIRTRDAQIDEARARVSAADRDGWPHPRLGAYFSTEGEAGTVQRQNVVLGIVGLPLPVWQRNQAARARARADVRVAQAERQAVQYSLAQQIRGAAFAVNTAAERVASYAREVLPKFEANMDLLERAYKLGETSLVEVLVARERFLKIQSEAIESYNSYYQAVFELERTVGAPFDTFAVATPQRGAVAAPASGPAPPRRPVELTPR